MESRFEEVETNDLRFDREKFILLDREEQLDFIKRKLDLIVQQFKEGLVDLQKNKDN